MQTETSSNVVGPADTSDGFEHGRVLGANAKFGAFGATPVVQPASPAGNVHTPTAGATTSVFVNTTFDGSIGSTAYTIGDIVIALKNLGFLAK